MKCAVSSVCLMEKGLFKHFFTNMKGFLSSIGTNEQQTGSTTVLRDGQTCCLPLLAITFPQSQWVSTSCFLMHEQVTVSSPGHRGSEPDRSRCGGVVWPCPHSDLPGRTEASGNWTKGKWNYTQNILRGGVSHDLTLCSRLQWVEALMRCWQKIWVCY